MKKRKKKPKQDPKESHCKVVGCSICEDERIKKAQNRAYKIEKAKLKGS